MIMEGQYTPTATEWDMLDRLGKPSHDCEAMSAVHVLAGLPYPHRLGDDVGPGGIYVQELLDDLSWSGGERVLVGAAGALWNGDGGTTLAEVVHRLDDHNLLRVIEAIGLHRRWWAAAPVAGSHVVEMAGRAR